MFKALKNRAAASCLLALACLALSGALTGCQQQGAGQTDAQTQAGEPVEVNVALYRSPISMGFASFMEQARAGQMHDDYAFAVMSDWGQIKDALCEGAVDLAVVPVGVAPLVYDASEGGVSIIDVCALGQVYVVTADQSVDDLADLVGRTVMYVDMGHVAETIAQHLVGEATGEENVTFERKSSASEVAAALSVDHEAVALLAEPDATAAALYDKDLRGVVDLSERWEAQGEDGSRMVGGVVVVRNAFAAEHPEVLTEFVEAHAASTQELIDDPTIKAQVVYDQGLVDTVELAERLVPRAHMVCLRGAEMRQVLSGFAARTYGYDDTPEYVALFAADSGFYYDV